MMTNEQIEMIQMIADSLPQEKKEAFLKDCRTTFIRGGVREAYAQHDVEGIFRDAIMALCTAVTDLYSVIAQLHQGELGEKELSDKIAEFRALNEYVEQCKTKAKQIGGK